MPHPFTLPLVGTSLLLSVAAGIHLGETTIGLVSPHFFQGPTAHPRDRGVAIDESRLPQRGGAYAGLYGWERGFDALAAHCIQCEALTASDAYAYSAVVPYFGSPEQDPATVTEEGSAADPYAKVIVPPEEQSRGTDERVLRYAYYPVESHSGMGGPDPYEDGLEPDQE